MVAFLGLSSLGRYSGGGGGDIPELEGWKTKDKVKFCFQKQHLMLVTEGKLSV